MVVLELPAAGASPRLLALARGALNERAAVSDPILPMSTMDTYLSEPPPLQALDEIDDPLIHCEDSALEPLIVANGLESERPKLSPKTAKYTAPVVGILRTEIKLSTGRSVLTKQRLQRVDM